MSRASPLLAVAALLLGACASTRLPPLSRGTVLDDDERQLWTACSRWLAEQERIGVVHRDAALEGYLGALVERLAPRDLGGAVQWRVRLILTHDVNAEACPNGAIFVQSGLLVALDDEAELAMLLGHEMTHVIGRHGARGRNDLRNSSAVSAVIGLGTLPSTAGFSRELEGEADRGGLQLAIAAGYSPEHALNLFEKLAQEDDSEGDVPQSERRERTHLPAREREDALKKLLAREPPPSSATEIASGPFLSRISPLLLDTAERALAAGRYSQARRACARRLAEIPGDPRCSLVEGQVERAERKPGWEERAITWLEKASAADRSFADPHRVLGQIRLEGGDFAAAETSFLTYLALAPTARDRGYVEGFLAECRKGSTR